MCVRAPQLQLVVEIKNGIPISLGALLHFLVVELHRRSRIFHGFTNSLAEQELTQLMSLGALRSIDGARIRRAIFLSEAKGGRAVDPALSAGGAGPRMSTGHYRSPPAPEP